MSKKSNKLSKIIFLLLCILFIVLIIVYVKIPNERDVVKKVTKEEYRNMIYDEVYNEVHQNDEPEYERKDDTIEDKQYYELEDDETLKMNLNQ